VGARLRRGEGRGNTTTTPSEAACVAGITEGSAVPAQMRPNNTRTGNKIGYGGEGHVATEKAVLD
jgi:hypothetical protein